MAQRRRRRTHLFSFGGGQLQLPGHGGLAAGVASRLDGPRLQPLYDYGDAHCLLARRENAVGGSPGLHTIPGYCLVARYAPH